MRYLLWIPIEILCYVIYTWLICKNNAIGGRWLMLLILFGMICQAAIIVSIVSKDLYFDGILYDFIMLLTFVSTMAVLGYGKEFSSLNWVGVFLALMAFVLIKV